MGGTAETSTSIVNEAITNSIVNISKLCAANALNLVDINVEGAAISGDVVFSGTVNQVASTTLNCNQRLDIETTIKSEMTNAVTAGSMTTGNNLLTGDTNIFSASKTDTDTVNRTLMTFDTSALMKCVNDSKNEYQLHFSSQVGGNFKFATNIDQSAKSEVSKCVQDTGILEELTSQQKTDIKATSAQVGTLVGLTQSAANIMAMCLILAIVASVVGIIAFAIKKRNGIQKPQDFENYNREEEEYDDRKKDEYDDREDDERLRR